MNKKLRVAALDTPARDQPVACVIGCRKTASDIMVPTATHPIRAPMATITQPYLTLIAYLLDLAASPYSRSASRQIDMALYRVAAYSGSSFECVFQNGRGATPFSTSSRMPVW